MQQAPRIEVAGEAETLPRSVGVRCSGSAAATRDHNSNEKLQAQTARNTVTLTSACKYGSMRASHGTDTPAFGQLHWLPEVTKKHGGGR